VGLRFISPEGSVQQDSLVFLLLESIPPDSLPRKFPNLRTMRRQQSYLECPGAGLERKRQAFWSSLKAILRTEDGGAWC
jgi:hypothetical protein